MKNRPDINEYIAALTASPRLGHLVVHHEVLPARKSEAAGPRRPLPEPLSRAAAALGAARLYRHQAEAMDRIREGIHVVTATPTASGKTLIYNLPVLERVLADPSARALYLFPLKALAQDQLGAFRRMADLLADPSSGARPTAAIYDGDTTPHHRRKIRSAPPNVILTNPEMLHLSFLPFHEKWEAFLSRLTVVVADEVHTYRGLLGSHMAQVFRRLRRICARYDASPTFVFSSATVANPGSLCGRLTGLPAAVVAETGAPSGRRHMVLMDSVEGPARTAILLLKAALHRGLRTIVYTQSRKMAELIAVWAGSRAGRFKDRISAYRAGFLPEERRRIEARLAAGDLLAVISTSALELGIDIGDLDLCLLVGYPGTIVAARQRAGRVGRGGQDSATVLIAGEDALDQYFIRNPTKLIQGAPEAAVVNPENPHILDRHLVCAAAEFPLTDGEPYLRPDAFREAAARLEASGDLLRSADGTTLFSRRKSVHRRVNLRGTGATYTIVEAETGRAIGEIDDYRAHRETHPGAVYLHRGRSLVVRSLDPETRSAAVVPATVDYYTRVRGYKETEILTVLRGRNVAGTRFCAGRLRITDQVTGYETVEIRGGRKRNIFPLDLPAQSYETEGIWFTIPPEVRRAAEEDRRHFMGGIHAAEHAAIGIFPLLVMTDRNDLGGISTPFHPQLSSAAIFIFDAVPGGAGLTAEAFDRAEELLEKTLDVIRDCRCDRGCPACVHSPKCGSGNRPIDKGAAGFILHRIIRGTPAEPPAPVNIEAPAEGDETEAGGPGEPVRFGVLDIETQRSAEEVGGWHRADLMRVSCAVLYDSAADDCTAYTEERIDALIDHLRRLDLVVGFNILRFDYRVLSGYSDFDFESLPTLDILKEARGWLGYRLSLDHLAGATLGAAKTADGLTALRWWKEGRLAEIIDYCRADVEITRDLYRFGREHRYLLFRTKDGSIVRLPVGW